MTRTRRDARSSSSRSIRRALQNLLAAAVLCASASVSVAADPLPLFVGDFLSRKAEWDGWIKAQQPLRLEGRVAGVGERSVRFLKVETPVFVVAEGRKLPRPTAVRRAEATGTLERRDGMPTFVVTSVRELPDDVEQVRVILKSIPEPRDKPERFYFEADWAQVRGDFYDDDALRIEARLARRDGFDIERRRAGDDPDRMLALARRAEQLAFDPRLPSQLRYEADFRRWKALRGAERPDFAPLVTDVQKHFPGTETPVPAAERDKIGKDFAEGASAAYRTADEARRRLLERMLFVEVQTAVLLGRVAENGWNGTEIADQIDQFVPERHAEAERLRDRALDFRLSTAGNLSQSEVRTLAADCRARRRTEVARQVLQTWMKTRLAQLRRDGLPGLIQAHDELASFRTEPDGPVEELARTLALEALAEARRLDPKSEAVLSRSTEDGAAKRPIGPASDLDRASREGRVLEGMTAEQVRRAVGEPVRITRIATAGHVSEVWILESASIRAVHFARHLREARDQAKVVRVTR